MKLLICLTFLLCSKLRGKALKCKRLDGPPNYGKRFFLFCNLPRPMWAFCIQAFIFRCDEQCCSLIIQRLAGLAFTYHTHAVTLQAAQRIVNARHQWRCLEVKGCPPPSVSLKLFSNQILCLAAFDMATAWLIFGNTATVWRSDFSEAAFIAKTRLESHISEPTTSQTHHVMLNKRTSNNREHTH